MKITLFTSNRNRHIYLINLLSKICDELFVVQECVTIHPGIIPSQYQKSEIMEKYFRNVIDAESKLFGNNYVNKFQKNVKTLPILLGDLNKCSKNFLKDFLNSKIYIVFGSSFIKNELVNFLVENRAINIHMGLSPYYRGTDCNFWALYDNNPHLVGATIHLLSKGLDSGPILYHALPYLKNSSFEYTMSAVKSAFHSLSERIKDNTIFEIETLIQNSNDLIRYSKKNEFNDKIVKSYLNKNINLNFNDFDKSLLKDPFFKVL